MMRPLLLGVVAAVACVVAASCAVDATPAGFPCPCPDDAWECVEDTCFLKSRNAECADSPPLEVADIGVAFATPNGAMLGWRFPQGAANPAVSVHGLYFVELLADDGVVTRYAGTNKHGTVRNDELRVARFEIGESQGEPVERTYLDGLDGGQSFTATLRVVGEDCAGVVGEATFTTPMAAEPNLFAFPNLFMDGWSTDDDIIAASGASCGGASQCLLREVECNGAAVCNGIVRVRTTNPLGVNAISKVDERSYVEIELHVETSVEFPPVGEGTISLIVGEEPHQYVYPHVTPRTSGETWRVQVPLSSFELVPDGSPSLSLFAALEAEHPLKSIGIDYLWPDGSRVVVDRIFIATSTPP